MDLPPPPPLFGRRHHHHHHHHHHHLRYGNVLHPPDFAPIPYGTHLPPQHPRPPHFLQPPPPSPTLRRPLPPPPGLYMPHPPLSPPFNFSPPHRPILGRADLDEFDPPPEPYFDRNDYLLPPLPPIPPRGSAPFRFIRDRPDRNPIFRDEGLDRDCGDHYIREKLHWSAIERHSRVLDMGDRERYRDGFYQSREVYDRRDDDDERRWVDGINDWRRRWDNDFTDRSHASCSERNYDERRWRSGFFDRDSDGGRWNYDTDWGHVPGIERVYDERNWNKEVIDRDHAIWSGRDYDDRKWNDGISGRVHEFYGERTVDESRLNYVGKDADRLRLESRQPEWLEDDLSLARFSDRLERVVHEGDFARSKKRRLQRNNASHKTEQGNVCSWHSREYKCQHFSKRSNNLSFRGKENEGCEQLETRTEDKKEKEQSPVDLAISFKSNALIGKAIMVPPCSVDKAGCNSMDVSSGKVDGMPGPSFAKPNEDMVEEDYITRELDLPFDPLLVSKEFLDKGVASGSRNVPTYDCNDLNGNSVRNEDLKGKKLQYSDIRSGRTRASQLRKMRNSRNQLMGENNLRMDEKVFGGTINSNSSSHDQFAFLTRENTSSAFIGTVPDTFLPSSLGGIVSRSGDMDDRSCKLTVSNLKRKGSSLTTLSTSSWVPDDLVTGSSSRAEGFLSNTKDAYCACRLSTDGFACHKGVTGYGDITSLEHANNVDSLVHSKFASLDAENRAIEPFNQYSRFCSHKVDGNRENSLKDRLAVCENAFARGRSEAKVSIEGHDMVGWVKTQESKILELQERKHYPESHESTSSSGTDSSLVKNPENAATSGMSSADANTSEISPAQVNIPHVEVDAMKEFRSLDGTVGADSLCVKGGVAMSSNFPSVGHKGNARQVLVSSTDAKRKRPSSDKDDQLHSIGYVEESREARSPVMTRLSSPDCPSRILGKRKAIVARMGPSDSETRMVIKNIGSIGGEDARCLPNNLVPAVEANHLDRKDYSKKDDGLNKLPSGIEDSTPEVGFGADRTLDDDKKKRKIASPRLKLSFLSDNDTVVDGVASDCSMLGLESTTVAELRAEQIEGTLSVPVAYDKCGPMDLEGKCDSGNLNVAGSDGFLADGNKLQVNDEMVTFANNLSSSADGNGFYSSNSSNELLASGFGMQSCTSSPEDILSLSGFSKNSGHRHAAPNIFPLGKPLEKEASDNSPTNTECPATLPEGKVVEKLNILHGKLISSKKQLTSAAPRVFPGRQPISSGNSSMFNSSKVTKSRTWHRTGNSTGVVTEPKVKPAPLPRSHGTKTTRNIQSSYIRKGNSLVRKASPSNVTTPGFHASSSSVYRLTPCTVNFKHTQVSNSRTGDADAPSHLRTEVVSVPETPEELPLKHNCQPLSRTGCNLGESLPVANVSSNDCPSKPLDSLEATVGSSVVNECQTGPVNNSDSQSTFEEENSRKKITYVKRRSNQLVASMSSDDISKLGVDKSQAPSSSDGYFKSKKYQLVRASSEDCDKKGDGNVNSGTSDTRAILTRTSNRRQSGFAKGYRSSKFSLVWKLHDTPPSEKLKKLLGPRKVWPQLFPGKKATHGRSFMHALGAKLIGTSFSTASQKLLLSRKRGAIYKRSTHGYSLRISKVLSVGGASLKWSKSIERNSKKANEEATRAVAAAEKRKKEENGAVPVASKSRNNVSRERIFRIGSERYKMDPTRRTLLRITDAEKESSSVAVQSAKNAKRSYVPRRLFIGNEEYVRIGNGNKLVRDPKKWTRVLASEKVRWSLRTARLRMARRRKYCQFFTRFGKCNKDDGKCPYIHDSSKIVVCTKFLNGSCSNADCKLTHKVIPERMQDCSYFLKGSCANENCPYRHVNVNPDSAVCESFLRGYCADGNECPKKHTYVCPAYEATGTCPQVSTCKLHHPKKKPDKKPTIEQKIVRGRYFDGGLVPNCSMVTTEKLSTKGTDDIVYHKGKFPDYISLEVSDDEMDHSPVPEQVCDNDNDNDTQPSTQIIET